MNRIVSLNIIKNDRFVNDSIKYLLINVVEFILFFIELIYRGKKMVWLNELFNMIKINKVFV